MVGAGKARRCVPMHCHPAQSSGGRFAHNSEECLLRGWLRSYRCGINVLIGRPATRYCLSCWCKHDFFVCAGYTLSPFAHKYSPAACFEANSNASPLRTDVHSGRPLVSCERLGGIGGVRCGHAHPERRLHRYSDQMGCAVFFLLCFFILRGCSLFDVWCFTRFAIIN